MSLVMTPMRLFKALALGVLVFFIALAVAYGLVLIGVAYLGPELPAD